MFEEKPLHFLCESYVGGACFFMHLHNRCQNDSVVVQFKPEMLNLKKEIEPNNKNTNASASVDAQDSTFGSATVTLDLSCLFLQIKNQ